MDGTGDFCTVISLRRSVTQADSADKVACSAGTLLHPEPRCVGLSANGLACHFTVVSGPANRDRAPPHLSDLRCDQSLTDNCPSARLSERLS